MYTEDYKGYQITIELDDSPECPFNDWDCEPPLAVYSDRYIQEYATQYGNVNNVPYLTREQIKANLPMILDVLDEKSLWALRDSSYSPDIVSIVNDRLSEAVDNMGNSDRLEALCEIYNAIGIPAVCKSVHGYSQGDYAEVLAVATPEFQEACGNGADYDWHESLKGAIQLFQDWAYGNVYGYIVEKDGEHVNSCWGFFGYYDNEYGALSEAQSVVDRCVERDAKDRIQRVKTWIRNRVPLTHRTFA